MTRVTVVVPAYNEEDRVSATVHSLQASGKVHEVIVVDDGSTDQTARRAEEAGARVVRLPANRGKTEAVRKGVEHAGDGLLLLVDADLGETAGLTTALLAPVLSGEADMAVAGWPEAGSAGGFGFVKACARWLIRRATGRTVNHPLSGQRALHRGVWNAWRGSYRYGFEVSLTIDALRAGYRLVEVPLPLTHRHMGRSLRGFVHRGRQLLHIVISARGWCFLR